MPGIVRRGVGQRRYIADREIAVILDLETQSDAPMSMGAPSTAIRFERSDLKALVTANPLGDEFICNECLGKAGGDVPGSPASQSLSAFAAIFSGPAITQEQNSLPCILPAGRHPPFNTAPIADSQRSQDPLF
jgi:hypothetical protein